MVCNICGSEKKPQNDNKGSLRENMNCLDCGSNSRDRAYIWSLGFAMNSEDIPLVDWKEKKEIRILETSGYRGHPKFLEQKFDYYNPKFSDDIKKLKTLKREYANVEKFFYENDFFDYVISSDVFEHVRLDNVGFENIYNSLVPGGFFVLTVPLFLGMPENLNRVKIGATQNEDVNIYPPFFHAEDSFVYRLYGLEILNQLNHLKFYCAILNFQEPKFNITAISVILSRKSKPLELNRLYGNQNVTIVKNKLQNENEIK